MKKSLALLVSALLVLTLVLPGVVLASGKGGGGRGQAAQATHKPTAGSNQHAATMQAKKAAKLAAKDARLAAKGVQPDLEGAEVSLLASPSVEGTKNVGPGVQNALEHIIANLSRKFAKFGDELPKGLLGVWEKFSTWLGLDTQVKPWEPVIVAPPTVETLPPPVVNTDGPPLDVQLPV